MQAITEESVFLRDWNLLRNKWKQPAVIWLLIFKQVLNCRSGSIDQNNACTKVTIRFLKRNTKFHLC